MQKNHTNRELHAKRENTLNTITLTLTLDEINLALEALGQQPFVRVHQLIGKIQQQATAQIQAEQSHDEGDQR
jgi:hypothetical protein